MALFGRLGVPFEVTRASKGAPAMRSLVVSAFLVLLQYIFQLVFGGVALAQALATPVVEGRHVFWCK